MSTVESQLKNLVERYDWQDLHKQLKALQADREQQRLRMAIAAPSETLAQKFCQQLQTKYPLGDRYALETVPALSPEREQKLELIFHDETIQLELFR